MRSRSKTWRVTLTDLAGRDFGSILLWTAQRFGVRQTLSYEATLTAAIEALHEGPDLPDAKRRDDLRPGLRTLRVARAGRRGSHVLLFQVESMEERRIDVVRILHDKMDFGRHLDDLDAED